MANEQAQNQPQRQPQKEKPRRSWPRRVERGLAICGLVSALLSLRGEPTRDIEWGVLSTYGSIKSVGESLITKAKKGYLIERMLLDIPKAVVQFDPSVVTDKLPIGRMGEEMSNAEVNAWEAWPPNADSWASPLTTYAAMYLSYLPWGLTRKYIVRNIRRIWEAVTGR